MTIQTINTSIKPSEEVQKINEIITDLNEKFQVVNELPENPDVNTFYFIPEE